MPHAARLFLFDSHVVDEEGLGWAGPDLYGGSGQTGRRTQQYVAAAYGDKGKSVTDIIGSCLAELWAVARAKHKKGSNTLSSLDFSNKPNFVYLGLSRCPLTASSLAG